MSERRSMSWQISNKFLLYNKTNVKREEQKKKKKKRKIPAAVRFINRCCSVCSMIEFIRRLGGIQYRISFRKFHRDLIILIQSNETFDRNLFVKRWSCALSVAVVVASANDRVLLPSFQTKIARIHAVTSDICVFFFLSILLYSTTKTEHLCWSSHTTPQQK